MSYIQYVSHLATENMRWLGRLEAQRLTDHAHVQENGTTLMIRGNMEFSSPTTANLSAGELSQKVTVDVVLILEVSIILHRKHQFSLSIENPLLQKSSPE